MVRSTSYPFRPKSTASLAPGQFWAVPLRGGYFGCGRVLQLRCSQLGKTRTAFFGGLQDWIGGEILGHRPLELDGFVLPELNSAYSLGANVLIGADIVRVARGDEWGTRPVLQYWSYGYIEQLAEELAGVRSLKR